MSDTPRTDKQAGYPDGSGCWKYTKLGLYVDADFARQLERENARLRWKYNELGLYVDADFARLRSELEAKMEDGYQFQVLCKAHNYAKAQADKKARDTLV